MCRWRVAAELAGFSPGCWRRRRGRRGGVGRAGSDDRYGASVAGARGGRKAAARRPSRRSRSPMSGPRRSPRPSATCRPVRLTPARRSRRRPPSRRPRRCRTGSGRQGQAQLADRSDLRQRPESTPAPVPPVKPQTVAELEQPNVASDASPDEPRSAPGRSSSRRCRRGGRPILRPLLRRRAHASHSSGGSHPRFEDRSRRQRFYPAVEQGIRPGGRRADRCRTVITVRRRSRADRRAGAG